MRTSLKKSLLSKPNGSTPRLIVALYDQIQRQNRKSTIYIFCDNARYYYNAELDAYLDKNPRIIQLFLPPYSPNLNLIERFMEILAKKVINTTFIRLFWDSTPENSLPTWLITRMNSKLLCDISPTVSAIPAAR
ncbi:MAG: transposase [Nitrosomonas sp.]|nr:transposase [Nitrosomonas sp.]